MACKAEKCSFSSCRGVPCLFSSWPPDPCILSHGVVPRPAPRGAECCSCFVLMGGGSTRPRAQLLLTAHCSLSDVSSRLAMNWAIRLRKTCHPYSPPPDTEPLERRRAPSSSSSSNSNERIKFVVNLIVLERVNRASGGLEVQRARYESQTGFRLQGMQLD